MHSTPPSTLLTTFSFPALHQKSTWTTFAHFLRDWPSMVLSLTRWNMYLDSLNWAFWATQCSRNLSTHHASRSGTLLSGSRRQEGHIPVCWTRYLSPSLCSTVRRGFGALASSVGNRRFYLGCAMPPRLRHGKANPLGGGNVGPPTATRPWTGTLSRWSSLSTYVLSGDLKELTHLSIRVG